MAEPQGSRSHRVAIEHCCDDMRREVDKRCARHPDPYDCGDTLVVYDARFHEYGLLIHDGEGGSGQSQVLIAHCPWCGAALPDSVRNRWFQAVEALGLDADDPAVPSRFFDDTWLGETDQV